MKYIKFTNEINEKLSGYNEMEKIKPDNSSQ
jgi:hypothetical protein